MFDMILKMPFRRQFLLFKPLHYCFQETIGFNVKALFTSRPASRLIRFYNKPGDIAKEFWEFSSVGLFMDWKLKTEGEYGKTASAYKFWGSESTSLFFKQEQENRAKT